MDVMEPERLARQAAFLVEIDRLKSVIRRTPIADNSRLENSAEHSWHLTLCAMTLHEYAPAGTDVAHTIAMLIVHDLVEVDAGDTFAYDEAANVGKAARESAAAARLFGMLPSEQGAAMRALWEEFEAQVTPSARFANALDRFQPLLLNMQAGGGSWAAYQVTRGQVLQRMRPIEEWVPAAWPFVIDIIDRACASGFILD